MEDNYSTKSSFDSFELHLSETAKGFLRETAKWAFFLSILGFIGLGFLVLVALFMFAAGGAIASAAGGAFGALGAMGGGIIGTVYLILAILYFFPVLYLFKFASKTKRALAESSTEGLTEGLENLKSHYKFIGIFTLIILSLYVLILIFAVIAGVASAV